MMRAQTLLKLFYLSIVDINDDSKMQYDYNVSRLAYQQEVEQLQMRIESCPINRKTKETLELMK